VIETPASWTTFSGAAIVELVDDVALAIAFSLRLIRRGEALNRYRESIAEEVRRRIDDELKREARLAEPAVKAALRTARPTKLTH
jgi:hypothetical protein